jgi:hypothetical protein
MQTGQNSIASESSFPQIEQVRWVSVLMPLTVLQPQSEPKATPRSIEWCEVVQRHPLRMMFRLQLQASVFSQGYQIRARIKIRDFDRRRN